MDLRFKLTFFGSISAAIALILFALYGVIPGLIFVSVALAVALVFAARTYVSDVERYADALDDFADHTRNACTYLSSFVNQKMPYNETLVAVVSYLNSFKASLESALKALESDEES